jgi:hypothetical protein
VEHTEEDAGLSDEYEEKPLAKKSRSNAKE